MTAAETITIVDITDEATFGRLPPCADPGFDHRSCDYWEDADRGSKAIRLDWLEPPREAPPAPRRADNPFVADLEARSTNPFAPGGGVGAANPFLSGGQAIDDNPFAPRPVARPVVPTPRRASSSCLAAASGSPAALPRCCSSTMSPPRTASSVP